MDDGYRSGQGAWGSSWGMSFVCRTLVIVRGGEPLLVVNVTTLCGNPT